jgi:2-polyprenyl-3-methyl-5-hydroxy-6-metoxy-1,4-benzoquinol methylase
VRHSFAKVDATPVTECPDCGERSPKVLGQYIYYSTLMRLRVCDSCRLIWADAHLDSRIVSAHFERAYKDREYFAASRLGIFSHLAAEIDRATPHGGAVLDIGGAQGDLMHLVTQLRPDIKGVVQDLSEKSVRHAEQHFGLRTLCGDVRSLESTKARYDVVVLSDVLYYEPQLAAFWRILPRILAPGGSIVIRVPNKLLLIRLYLTLSAGAGNNHDKIKYFNPEHIYILSRRYLTTRLKRLGFDSLRAMVSPPLNASRSQFVGLLGRVLFHGAAAIGRLSGGRLLLTPSIVIVGTRPLQRTHN